MTRRFIAMTKSRELRRVETLRRSGQLEKAAASLRELLSKDTRDADLARKYADLLAEMGKIDSAISQYVKLQEFLAAQGDLLGAISAGLKVVELDPKFENPLAYVAKVKTQSLREEQIRKQAETVAVEPITPLSDLPFLSELRSEEITSVAASMRRHEKREGETICEEGEAGESLFFVTKGLLEVKTKTSKLGLLSAGQCFGEISFLTRQPRTATVRALEESELLELSADRMRPVVQNHPRLQAVLFNLYRDRALVNVLSRSPLFEILSSKDRARLAPRFELVTLAAGDAVFKEGDKGSALFLIKDGSLEVQANMNGELIKLATLGRHQFFGEVSFLTGVPRTATVHATEPTELLRIEEEDLKELIRHHPFLKQVLSRYHLDRVTATTDTLKAFLKKDRVDGILS